jgi:hypothetical protein
MPFLLICLALFLFFALADRLQGPLQRWILQRRLNRLLAEEQDYRYILEKRLPAFKMLGHAEQVAMLRSIFCFQCSKSFHFVGMQEEKEMAVLISAAIAMRLPVWPEEAAYSARDFYVLHTGSLGADDVSRIHMDDPSTIYIAWEAFLQAIHTLPRRAA